MAGQLVGYHPYPVYVESLGCDVTFVVTTDGRRFASLRHVCEGLGVASSSQSAALRSDEDYAGALETFNVPTSGGMQELLFLRQRECAWWIVNINPRRVRADVRGRLTEIRDELMAHADRLAFGDRSALPRVVRAALPPARGEYTGHCPYCVRAIALATDENGVARFVGREEGR